VVQVPAEKPTRGVPAGTATLLPPVQFRPTRAQTRAELIGQRLHRRDGRKPALKPLSTQAAFDSLIGQRPSRYIPIVVTLPLQRE
jgi:hypothetical protein